MSTVMLQSTQRMQQRSLLMRLRSAPATRMQSLKISSDLYILFLTGYTMIVPRWGRIYRKKVFPS